jgi:FAD/FMN-containing dehydrogenase
MSGAIDMAGTRVLGNGTVAELRESLSGQVITSGDPDYEAARRVWNGAIDKRPAIVAQCAGVGDVVEAIRFARSERLVTAVRGGGHGVAGYATCDDGIVIDLSPMRGVEVDAAARIARVQGGALWSDVDAATQAFGLGTPGGLISTTGVAGLTLGGGVGWLSRKHGLACDNLVSARLVTADGSEVTASEDENPDLFWALRGGGGNFGVVTSFEFRLHSVGEVFAGAILHPLERAGEFLRAYRELTPEAPDELTTVLGITAVPPSPDFPAELHGRKVLAVGVCYAGPPEDGERAIAPLRAIGEPLLERVQVMPYTVRQRLQDPSAPAGLFNYWKSDYLTGLDDDLIDLVVERAARTTSPRTQLHLYQLGGAAARVGEGEAAYTHRSAPYLFSIISLWDDPAADPSPHVEWTRDFWSRLRPYAAGAYVNFLGAEGSERVRDAYGAAKYARLANVKADYDPTNFFRLNQNVEPAV